MNGVLPPLDRCTDPSSLRAELQRALPGFADGRLRIEALHIAKMRRSSSIRRNPNPLTLVAEARIADLPGRRTGLQTWYCKVFREGASRDAHAGIDVAATTPVAFGDAVAHVPSLDMLVWSLPNDPGLPQLAALLAGDCLGERADGVELLRYEPEVRATLRCTLPGDPARVVFGKTFSDARGREIHERFVHLWQRSQEDASAPLVAAPLAYDETTRTMWQESAQGVPLSTVIGGPSAAATLVAVGRALAALHGCALTSTQQRSVDHWIAEMGRRVRKVRRGVPALADRVAAVAAAIERGATVAEGRTPSLIHGDFHPDQVWLHDGRVLLFDFDEFSLGDPMEDLAAFIVKLDPHGRSPSTVDALPGGYADAAPDRFDRRSLNWHVAVQRLLQVSRAFIFQQPGWAAEMERRLVLAEAAAGALDAQRRQP